MRRLLEKMLGLWGLGRQAKASRLPGSSANERSDFSFREDGSLVDLRVWHARYLRGKVSDELAGQLDRHLLHHRRDRSLWDALTLELEREVASKILGRDIEEVWGDHVQGSSPEPRPARDISDEHPPKKK